MTLRDKRQLEFADKWLETKFAILNLTARFGKIRTTIRALEKLGENINVLITYPDNKIKKSWEDDFEAMGYDTTNVTYSTHLSIGKYVGKKYDVIVIDEIHTLSENQLFNYSLLLKNNRVVLGLTGTLSRETEITLNLELDLYVAAEYTIEQAIEEGVIVDYEINVIRVPLDTKTLIQYSKKKHSEKKQFDNLTWVINKQTYSGGDSMFLRLNRMRIIQNSLAKLNATKQLLQQFKNDRILVFCGTTKTADALGIPTHHSKTKKNDNSFIDFSEGENNVNHLAVIKIGNTGITYQKLNKIIINYFDSNAENLTQKIFRCLALEYDNPQKKAYIYIISSTEPIEGQWLNKALRMFDETKIKYL